MTNSIPEPEDTAEPTHTQDKTGSLGTNQQSLQSSERVISVLFQAAVAKLDRIDSEAKGQKIKIIQNLAKDLEGRIPTDSIATEIAHQLRGKVSERLVHDCLELKYKQKYRVENAKLQKRRKQIINTDLAAPVPLEKREIIVDAAGNEPEAPVAAHFTNQQNTDDKVSGIDEAQGQESKCSNCDLVQKKYEQSQLKLLEYEDVVRTQTSIRTAEEITHRCSDGYLQFQFSIPFEPLRLHMVSSCNLNKSVDRIWFTGKLNPETAKVVNVQVLKITAVDDGQFDDTKIDRNDENLNQNKSELDR